MKYGWRKTKNGPKFQRFFPEVNAGFVEGVCHECHEVIWYDPLSQAYFKHEFERGGVKSYVWYILCSKCEQAAIDKRSRGSIFEPEPTASGAAG